MSMLDKLERRFGRFAIRGFALYLIIGQVALVFAVLLGVVSPAQAYERFGYSALAVTHLGEVWRMVTFLFVVPLPGSLLGYVFLAFGWYLFYLMSNALEDHWGAFRFNVYLFLSWALTVGLAFVTPFNPVSNLYILGSVFLAFAYLNPDFELTLFFILPVKIKWLAIIAWAMNLVDFVRGDLADRLQIGAAVASFLVFFGPDMVGTLRQGRRTAQRRAAREEAATQPRHTCHVCGKTDRSHPQLDFRYCSKCAGDQCYCPEHIQNHAHVIAPDEPKAG